LAAGAPVIALGRGGALDIIQDGETGVLFNDQTVDAVAAAILRSETIAFKSSELRRKAKRFDKGLFITKIRTIVVKSLKKD